MNGPPDMRGAFRRLTRERGYTHTFEEAMQSPLLSRIIRLEAEHPRPEYAEPVKRSPTVPAWQPRFRTHSFGLDNKRRAAGEREDD